MMSKNAHEIENLQLRRKNHRTTDNDERSHDRVLDN